jgi:hypothetical protein
VAGQLRPGNSWRPGHPAQVADRRTQSQRRLERLNSTCSHCISGRQKISLPQKSTRGAKIVSYFVTLAPLYGYNFGSVTVQVLRCSFVSCGHGFDEIALARIFHKVVERRSGGSIIEVDITRPNESAHHHFFKDRL